MSLSMPTHYIPHGGGPCFFMDWTPANTWAQMGAWLRQLASTLPQTPQAIVVISAHWEANPIQITSASQPSLIYDYYGFPEHTYQLTYAAAGAPELAQRVYELLQGSNIPAELNPERGFDHGLFIPFKLIYPDAHIPMIQISLHPYLDPAYHVAIGQALAPLRQQNIWLVGSGMSFHNLKVFGQNVQVPSQAFDDWLKSILGLSSFERAEQLKHWKEAPSGRFCHPREEHLLPLMVVAGAAPTEPGHQIFSNVVMGAVVSAFQFGGALIKD